MPWKITEGQLLYRDVAYNYGPLSPYLNALLLALFGVHLTTFIVAGLAGAAAGGLLVFLLARRFLGRLGSLAVVAVYLFECVFQHYYWNGSFNFILPYSYPAVHSVLFALGALLALFRFFDRPHRGALAVAGGLAGLALLGKIEVGGAIVLTLGAATLYVAGRVTAATIKDTAAWTLPCLAIFVAGYLPFVAASSWQQVVERNVLRPGLVDVRSNTYFLHQLGIADLSQSLSALGLSALFWVAAAALALWLSRRAAGGDRRGARLAVAAGLTGVLVAVTALPGMTDFRTVYRIVPLVAVAVLGSDLIRRLRGGEPTDPGLFALALLALLSVARIVLNVGTQHYGFFMALPGLLLLAVVLAGVVPARAGLKPVAAAIHAGLMLALLLAVSGRHFVVGSWPKIAAKQVEVGGPQGRLLAHPRPFHLAIAEALDLIQKRFPADGDETLLVLPEGAGLNFLTGRLNPTSYNLFTPPELEAPGVEEELLRQLAARPPRTILLVDREVAEYGRRGLGVDYGHRLTAFVVGNYEAVARIGRTPFADPAVEGGCIVFRRRAPSSP